MNLGRKFIAGAAGVTSAIALAACGSSTSGLVQHPSVSFSYNGPVTSLWQGTSDQYSTYNGNVGLLNEAAFNYYNLVDGAPKLVPNTSFGTYSVVNKSPLTIKLAVNKGVTWSDGTQVGAADILLNWASGLTKYNNATGGGVNFNAVGPYGGVGLDTLDTPKVDADGLGLTVTFKKPYVDWEVAVGTTVNGLSPGLPAHIVYELAFPSFKGTAADADAAVQKAVLDGDTAVMGKLANAYKNGWNTDHMPTDPRLLVADGPYTVSAFVKNQSISFKLRPDYKAGPSTPTVENFTIRFIADATAQVQALQNGEVQMIQGQPSTDTVSAVKKLSGIKVDTFNGATYEHVDLNMGVANGAFNPASYGGDAQKALMVRQAFLKALPRQEIIDKLVHPLNPTAGIDDSALFLPGTDGYKTSVANNGASAYDSVDIAGAKALLQQAGASAPSVRFTYPSDNPRRVSEFQLIQKSEEAAGFKIVPVALTGDKYFPNLQGGAYDASIFAWQFTSLAFTSNMSAYIGKGGQNFQGYANPASDALWRKLSASTGSTEDNNAIMAQIDKNYVADAMGLSIFQFPEMSAWSDKIQGASDNPIANGSNLLWDPWDWKVTGAFTSSGASASATSSATSK